MSRSVPGKGTSNAAFLSPNHSFFPLFSSVPFPLSNSPRYLMLLDISYTPLFPFLPFHFLSSQTTKINLIINKIKYTSFLIGKYLVLFKYHILMSLTFSKFACTNNAVFLKVALINIGKVLGTCTYYCINLSFLT